MSPTLRHDQSHAELDVVSRSRVPVAAHVYSYALLAVALGTVVGLAVTGSSLPSPGPLLVLALPLALCMNRFLFFANETGVTADAAVIFAAMVAFHDDAVWLGPLLLALLVGPLDAKHWGDRAWVRMAYNSGSTALVAGAGLAVYVPLSRTLGSSWPATLGAVAVAAIPYIAVETGLGSVLIVFLGESLRASARHQLPQIWIALPLAIVGALAGLAAVGIGWWCAFVILLPVPLAPELVFVTVPRRIRARSRHSTVVVWIVVAAALLVASVALPGSEPRALAGLAAVACLVIAESRPDRSMPLPPLTALLVVVPIAALFVGAPANAVILAAVAGSVFLALFARPTVRAAWMLPLVAVAACLGRAWGMAGRLGASVFCAAMIASLFLAGSWGPPPWPSRIVGPTTGRRPNAHGRTVLAVVAFVTIVLGGATATTTGSTRVAYALVTTALLELMVTTSAFAVRMWRFAPRRRWMDALILAATSTVALLVYLPLAIDGRPLAVAVVVLCTMLTAYVAWPLSRLMRDGKTILGLDHVDRDRQASQ